MRDTGDVRGGYCLKASERIVGQVEEKDSGEMKGCRRQGKQSDILPSRRYLLRFVCVSIKAFVWGETQSRVRCRNRGAKREGMWRKRVGVRPGGYSERATRANCSPRGAQHNGGAEKGRKAGQREAGRARMVDRMVDEPPDKEIESIAIEILLHDGRQCWR